MIKKFLSNASIILFVTVISLVILELVAYLYIAKFSNQATSKQVDGLTLGPEQLDFFKEYKGTANIPYKSHIGWESKEFHGSFINIGSDGLRETYGNLRGNSNQTAHFFGSSTIWGYGVKDDGSIPSIFSSITNIKTQNYAELAWTSRQSLNRLISHLNQIKKGDIVLFYDGYNDSAYGCYPGMIGAHAREQQINNALLATSYGDHSIKFEIGAFFRKTSIYKIFERHAKQGRDEGLGHHSACNDPRVAKEVANFLINNWLVADELVKSRGAKFYCVLQPSVFVMEGYNSQTTMHDRESISAVYPVVLSSKSQLPCLVNLSGTKIPKEFHFDPQGHLTRQGNQIIAETFANLFGKKFN